MRSEFFDRTLPSRVQGRAALVRRLRGLLVATHRYGRGRARTRADIVWAARMIDGLTVLLEQEGKADAPNKAR
jgi:hypothetical protein